jgi:O-antigen/teichoic acid export membrane protein
VSGAPAYGRDAAVMAAGQAAALVIGVVSSAVLARTVGPSGLRVLGTLAAVQMIAATAADLGLRGSVVRHAAADLPTHPERAGRLVRAGVAVQLGAALALVVAVNLAAAPLGEWLRLPTGTTRLLIALASLGILTRAAGGAVAGPLQALGRFEVLASTQVLGAAVTLSAFGLLAAVGQLEVEQALMVGVVAGAAVAITGSRFLPASWRHALRSVTADAPERRQLLRFGRWLWLGALATIAYVQADFLLVNTGVSAREAGIYALALSLSLKVAILGHAAWIVLVPAASALRSDTDRRAFVRRATPVTLVAAGLVVAAVIVAGPAIALVYGEAFAPAAAPFRLLALTTLIDLLALPVVVLAFPLDAPRAMAATDWLRLVALVPAVLVALPRWGLVGAAGAKLAVHAVGTLLLAITIQRRSTAAGRAAGCPDPTSAPVLTGLDPLPPGP